MAAAEAAVKEAKRAAAQTARAAQENSLHMTLLDASRSIKEFSRLDPVVFKLMANTLVGYTYNPDAPTTPS